MLHVASNKKSLVQQKKERKKKIEEKCTPTAQEASMFLGVHLPSLPLLSPAPQPDLRPSFMLVWLQRGVGGQLLLALSLHGVGGVGGSHRCGFHTCS